MLHREPFAASGSSSPSRLDTVPWLEGAEGWSGHNALIRRDRLAFARLVADAARPLSRVKTPFAEVVAVGTPETAHEVLVERASDFMKSAMLRFVLYPLGGDGLFTSDGDLWKRQRKLMAPLFHQGALTSYAEDMVTCAERTVATWRDGEELPIFRETTRMTMAIAGKTLFDADTFSEADEIGAALTEALDWTANQAGGPLAVAHLMTARMLQKLSERSPGAVRGTLESMSTRLRTPLFLPGKEGQSLQRALDRLDAHVQHMIDDRRASPERNDLLARLLHAHDDELGRMSDKQLRDEVLTLFVAGHETTATGLAWTVDLLCRHPEWYARVRDEVDALGHRPTVADLPRLTVCSRVFKEALRVHPPVYFFGRTALRDTVIGNVQIPRFTNVVILPWALHRHPRVWPEPERFDPDRFLASNEQGRHRTAWLPFGAGPRVCIGNHFALMEGPLVLATMFRDHEFELLARDEPEPFATLRPKQGVPVRIRKRVRTPS
jgi:cytochrome P450